MTRQPPLASLQAEASLPTSYGAFRILVFSIADTRGEIVALVHGQLEAHAQPLVRLHSECLTGDVLGSLRCDCGEQLRWALGRIASAGAGALLYLRQEGRGIGILNKIRAYALQDTGLDTVDANVQLGLPVDGREYASAAAVLRALGLTRVGLLTNNPRKVEALGRHGIEVAERVPLEVAPNSTNHDYLRTKADRLGHLLALTTAPHAPNPTSAPALARPRVTVHYAQTLDGRLATRTGNSQWIGGPDSLVLAHELRATHHAIMVGIGTVLADDPKLTVRLVPGTSPIRIVVDSSLRIPLDAQVLTERSAPTLVATTPRAGQESLRAVRERGAEPLVLGTDPRGKVDLVELLAVLARRGIESVLVEGGAGIITSLLRVGAVDRLVVCIAPKVIGSGIEAIGNLDILRLSEALTFTAAEFHESGGDLIFDGRVRHQTAASNQAA